IRKPHELKADNTLLRNLHHRVLRRTRHSAITLYSCSRQISFYATNLIPILSAIRFTDGARILWPRKRMAFATSVADLHIVTPSISIVASSRTRAASSSRAFALAGDTLSAELYAGRSGRGTVRVSSTVIEFDFRNSAILFFSSLRTELRIIISVVL